ncbi:uncharacterized protein LOC126380402 [Pectinophora gossypiella]|uniref:uncharacterized protein LOC126380402 n=1 Tax=Pectinophora gossypiella TaxID=13191 RepID=UPI00214E3D0E|nr:uncharacterized protein LOC126380402 [Pectinophora gossypiella]
MGLITSCCRPSASDVMTPDAETRRRQLVEAAEKRRLEEEARGVKDPTKVKRMMARSEEMEKREKQLEKEGGAALRWTSN